MAKSTNTSKVRGSGIAGNKRDCFDDERTDPTFIPSCKRRKCTETSIRTQPRRVVSLRRNPSASKKPNTLLGPSSPLYDAFGEDLPYWPSRKRSHVVHPEAKEYDQKDATNVYSGKLNGYQFASITMKETTVRCPLAFLPKDFNQKKRKGNTYLFLLCSLALSLENERSAKKQKVDRLVEENHLNNDDASHFSEAEWGAVEALYSMKAVTPIPDERVGVEAPVFVPPDERVAAEAPFAMEAIEELSAPAIVQANIPEPCMPAESKIESVASELQSTGDGPGFVDATSRNITDTNSLQTEEFKALLPCCNIGFQSSKIITDRCELANELIPIAVASSELKPPKPGVFNVCRRKSKLEVIPIAVVSHESQSPQEKVFLTDRRRNKVKDRISRFLSSPLPRRWCAFDWPEKRVENIMDINCMLLGPHDKFPSTIKIRDSRTGPM